MSPTDLQEEVVSVADGRIDIEVDVRGDGPPLVYLHGAGGLTWDPFLDELSGTRTVYAPRVPAGPEEAPNWVDDVGDLWELVLLLEETLQALELGGADMLGCGFGGMLACELQATFPGAFGSLITLDPLGLWRENAEPANWSGASPDQLTHLLFSEVSEGEATASKVLTQEGPYATLQDAWTAMRLPMRRAAKFVQADRQRGLQKRLHRIIAPTLVVWGELDALTPPAHAAEFASRVRHARVEILPGCGHVPQVERPEETLALVRDALY